MESRNALVILSGGQDSTTCLYWALERFGEVNAITFNYGQRHAKEIESAMFVAKQAGVKHHHIITMNDILLAASPLLSDKPPEQYKDFDSLPGGLEDTFVPMRNQLFITVAANHAYALGCRDLVTGVCQEDFGGYPDCRQSFIDAVSHACNEGTFTGQDGALDSLEIHTPLMDLTKHESVDMAMSLQGCYKALAYTHTAYDGQFPPVGKDHATLLREKGFFEAGVPDPLIVRAVDLGLMQMPEAFNYTAEKLASVAHFFTEKEA